MKKSVLVISVLFLLAVAAGVYLFYGGLGDQNSKEAAGAGNSNPVFTDQETPETSSTGTAENSGANLPASYDIQIKGFAFSPSALSIKVGDGVTWTNMDSAPHTITSDSGNELDSETLSKGNNYSHTFTTAGTYEYHCGFHPGMKATIIVE